MTASEDHQVCRLIRHVLIDRPASPSLNLHQSHLHMLFLLTALLDPAGPGARYFQVTTNSLIRPMHGQASWLPRSRLPQQKDGRLSSPAIQGVVNQKPHQTPGSGRQSRPKIKRHSHRRNLHRIQGFEGLRSQISPPWYLCRLFSKAVHLHQ